MSIRAVIFALAATVFATQAHGQIQGEPKIWAEQIAGMMLKKDVPAIQQAIRQASEKPEHGQVFVNAMQSLTAGFGTYGAAVMTETLKDKAYGTTHRLVVSYIRYRETELYVQWRFLRDDKNWWIRSLSYYDSFDKAAALLQD
ncbi:hypothetical protein [Ferrovibrio terrae]|uniref:hypothetical protein n=1 Tax=Ferrovibrio terrae TaxID=2594003 RepID=UPI0031378958